MKSVNVEIMGQSLVISSDEDDEWVRTVAAAVDGKIRDISAHSRTVNTINLAILTAMTFADELERLKREHQQLLDQIEALSRRLTESAASLK